MPLKTWVDLWKKEVFDKAKEIDELDDELHWSSMCFGWALGKGMELEDAQNFADYVSYKTDLI